MADRMMKTVGGRGAWLDRAMAAFAGGAAGFFTFMMPANLGGGMIGIGTQTGRAAVAVGAAIVTFLGVSFLLRALSGAARRNEGPRLRRADMHPDAPARTPILAASELGVPLDHVEIDARTSEAIDLEAIEDAGEMDAGASPFWIPEDKVADEAAEVEAEPAESEGAVPGAASPLPFWFEDAGQADDTPPDADAERPPKVKAIDHDHIASLVDRLGAGGVQRSRTGGPSSSGPTVREPDRQLEERLRGAIKDLRRAASG